ncbi:MULTISPECIES: flagellar protein FlgN [unclassified Candidatus Frackibacter]|uniref:flagellar protein FlgN n=1 Tax=unclassified Candidatus Frackibacter TaxID=2648818 RepID=UPI000889AD99|nr:MULTISPECIES: flagellar protein FlgN [unclassified Candidatus Frackibacter]SDC72495.1 FlgN protein [Candidatus Frackibacter sp. WG11]SEM86767.1 FlgN protein [Candidatus Frackibacter sp. WG12]SFL95802.1 FlgN protein [Candidatus Frackibacter sp. WG13]
MNIERLVQILEAEYKMYQKIYQLSGEKKEIIVDNRVDDLLSIIEEEKEEILKIDELEAERVEILKGLACEYSLTEEELSFAKLMDLISDPAKSELKEIRQELLDILEEIKAANETNANLIKESLKLNNYTLQLLTESNISKDNTYQKPGKEAANNQQQRRIIDQKA